MFAQWLQRQFKDLEVKHTVITPKHYPQKPIEALCGVFILESTPKEGSDDYQTVLGFRRDAARLFEKLKPMKVLVILDDTTAKDLVDFDPSLAQRAHVVQSTLGVDRIASYINTEILGTPFA